MNDVRARCGLALVGLALAGAACGQGAATPLPDPATPVPSLGVPMGLGSDARLGPVLSELSAHPGWTGGAVEELTVLGAWPSLHEVCVLATDGGDGSIVVAVDPETRPWSVLAVTSGDAETGEPVVHFERDGYDNADLCRSVVGRSEQSFPSDSSGIEVTGGWTDEGQVPAIATALFADPHSFGVDRSGRPAIAVSPLPGPGRDDLVCLTGTVYIGGPRAVVVLGLTQGPGGWDVRSVRVTEQALRSPEPAEPGGC